MFVNFDAWKATFFPCTPFRSWLTAITSGFVRICKVSAVILVTSHPIKSGALLIAHREKCDRYSASVIPPLPTSSTTQTFNNAGTQKEFLCSYCQDHSNHQDQLCQQIHYSKMQGISIYLQKERSNITVSMLRSIDFQLSWMSGVVLQLFPTSGAQRAGESTPHSKWNRAMFEEEENIDLPTTHWKEDRSTSSIQSISHRRISHFGFRTIIITVIILKIVHFPWRVCTGIGFFVV